MEYYSNLGLSKMVLTLQDREKLTVTQAPRKEVRVKIRLERIWMNIHKKNIGKEVFKTGKTDKGSKTGGIVGRNKMKVSKGS